VVANGSQGEDGNTALDSTTVKQMAGRSNRRKGKCMAEVFLYDDMAHVLSGLDFLYSRDKHALDDDAAFIFRYAATKFATRNFKHQDSFLREVMETKSQKAEI